MVAVVASPTSQPHAAAQPREGWWRYLDRSRAHEVLAQWLAQQGRFLIRETSPLAPGATLEETHRIAQPWEARLALWLLEARLSQLGEYWRARSTSPGWMRIGRPVNAPIVDLRPNEVLANPALPLVHHYYDEHGAGDTLVAAVRAKHAERFVVIRARMDVPSFDVGRIDVVHPLLPAALVKSRIAREQIGLAQAGLPKLVTKDDYLRAFGGGADRRAARLVDTVATRVHEGQFERPLVPQASEDVYIQFLDMLSDPRLLALHNRFLVSGEEDEVLAGGPPLIRRAIAAKRAAADHHEQHLLTILEASLLARERMHSGKLTRHDPEVRALTRLAYYL